MIRTNKGWIGVDIGTHNVKLVQVERTGSRIQLTDALVIRRREAWEDLSSSDPPLADSGEEMRAGLSLGQGFAGQGAAVTLTMSLCDIRALAVAPGTPVERRELVSQELNALSGSTEDDREFDFWPIDVGGDNQNSPETVLTASIPRGWSQQIAKDLSDAKLVGNVLDVLPLTLARAVEIGAPGSSSQPVAAVDWGYRRATLCIVVEGCPVFVRCLRDAGLASVISALGRTLSITGEEAQKLLTDHGLPIATGPDSDELQGVIAEVISQQLQNFSEEVDRTMTFLRQQRRSLLPQQIVLFGGGAAIRNIAPYLSEKIDIPIAPWSLPGRPSSPGRNCPPLPLLGPAVALSALAWE